MGLVEAHDRRVIRLQLGRPSTLIESDADLHLTWPENDWRIITINPVLGFLIGLTLSEFAVGQDAPDVAGGYRAGLPAFQHNLDVRGRSIHYAIGVVPIAPRQLSAKDDPVAHLGAGHP